MAGRYVLRNAACGSCVFAFQASYKTEYRSGIEISEMDLTAAES